MTRKLLNIYHLDVVGRLCLCLVYFVFSGTKSTYYVVILMYLIVILLTVYVSFTCYTYVLTKRPCMVWFRESTLFINEVSKGLEILNSVASLVFFFRSSLE